MSGGGGGGGDGGGGGAGSAGAGSDGAGEGTGASSSSAESSASSADGRGESTSTTAVAERTADPAESTYQKFADSLAPQSRGFEGRQGTPSEHNAVPGSADQSAPAQAESAEAKAAAEAENPSQSLGDRLAPQSRAFEQPPTSQAGTGDRDLGGAPTSARVAENPRAETEARSFDSWLDAQVEASQDNTEVAPRDEETEAGRAFGAGTPWGGEAATDDAALAGEPRSVDSRLDPSGRSEAGGRPGARDSARPAAGEDASIDHSQQDSATAEPDNVLPSEDSEAVRRIGPEGELTPAIPEQRHAAESGTTTDATSGETSAPPVQAELPIDRSADADQTVTPERADAAPESYGPLEGQEEFDVYDPVTGNRITDIDRFEADILWEEKSAVNAINWATALDETAHWIEKHIDQKFAKYVEAREALPEYYREAGIGFSFVSPGVDEGFKIAVEAEVKRLRSENRDITIHVRWRE